MSRPATLDRPTSFALILIAEAQALLLYAAHRAMELDVALFDNRAFLTVWYSVVVIPPAIVSLQLSSVRDRFAWASGAGVAAVVALLAWHTGGDCGASEAILCEPVMAPYVFSMAIGHFILLPFIQGFREHRWRIPYASLFHSAWDNALTVAATAFFVGAAWLILALWAALFALVGIGFFEELFAFSGFVYPVTGLLAGFGVVLARHQAGALQAVLRLCLSLGRALLPLISILALVFLATLVFTGLQPLWDTKTATLLLLLLIFGTVALVNSVLHDGTGVDSYRPALRRLMGAALLSLPAYAIIAIIALTLRVGQYGWTVDRLWAAVLVFIAAAYSFAYAASAIFRRQGQWLGLLPNANVSVALMIVLVLFATQSPMLDFRAITVSSQLARFQAQTGDLEAFDFDYFRWELGQPGYDALVSMKDDPRVAAAPVLARQLQGLIDARHRWGASRQPELAAGDVRVLPEGEAFPAGLLAYMNSGERHGSGPGNCFKGGCVLVGLDLLGGPGLEWVLVDPDKEWSSFPVYESGGRGWKLAGSIHGRKLMDPATVEALRQGQVSTEPVNRRDLVIGQKRMSIRLAEPQD